MPRRLPLLAIVATAAVFLIAPCAQASTIIARNASQVTLIVNGKGQALVSFKEAGVKRRLLASGAINARQPNPVLAQVHFKLHYSPGAFHGVCLPYDGPALAWLVKACKAPDGSYWALQSWQRLNPDYGGVGTAWELHLSHWTGPLAALTINLDWKYGQQHLFGMLTYNNQGVYGFSSSSAGNPNDSYGRNIYVDTFNSRYGKGWSRENSFLTHKPKGTFCYGFYPHGRHPSGIGSQYRATVIGPGVTPDVMWQGNSIGSYSASDPQKVQYQQQMTALERSYGDPHC